MPPVTNLAPVANNAPITNTKNNIASDSIRLNQSTINKSTQRKQITQITQPTCINNIISPVPVKKTGTQLNVVIYDKEKNLYLEQTHKFIVTPLNDKIKIIGKLFDNRIIPLDRNDKIFAIDLGLCF
jgi:hypothetical protein